MGASSLTTNSESAMNQTTARSPKTCATTRTADILSVSCENVAYHAVFNRVRFFFVVKHVCHLNELNDEQLNKLLNNIVDMENLYISISRQDDLDIKKVKSMNSMGSSAALLVLYLSGLHLLVKAPSSLHPHEEPVDGDCPRPSRGSTI